MTAPRSDLPFGLEAWIVAILVGGLLVSLAVVSWNDAREAAAARAAATKPCPTPEPGTVTAITVQVERGELVARCVNVKGRT